ncbi:unnamed protein product [Mytilus coruscus]|uniref:CARD domain-containing protein n=1 Tax=Mytilus coruscus TaxID=42192 RepID=A0A6J8A2N1_MYTCO|nr:unnamed protein product [Mytilus coruscus]
METSPREIQAAVDESMKIFGKFELRLKETTFLYTNILDHLISKCILSTQDREEIFKQETQSQRNAQLLYILKRQPYDTFYFLVEALKEDKDDFEKIDECKKLLHEMISERSHTVPAIPFLNLFQAVEDRSVRLQKNFRHLINNIANARSHMDHLYAKGILTTDEMEHMNKQQTTKGTNRMFLSIIFAKATSMDVYQTFLDVLEDNIDKDLVKTIKGTEVLDEEKKLIRIDHKSLVVSGPSGVGKTASVRHVALQLENESYTIIFLREAEDIKQYYKSGPKTLYVVDDLCGNYTGNKKQLKKWKKLEEDIQYRLEHGNCKLIATCRLQVFQDIKSTDIKLFANECNLISKGNNLTNSDKEKLAEKYFHEAADKAKEHLAKYECFPYLCKFYYDNKDKTEFCLKLFLEKPFSFLTEELRKLKGGNGKNNKGRLRFCALVLLVISNNNLKESTLEGKNQMIFDTLQKCELSTNITGKDIKSELDTLIDTFVIKREQSYCATHEKMFDFLAFHMAVEEKLLDIIILYASESLVCERLSVGENPVASESLVCEKLSVGENPEPDPNQISNQDYLITIPDEMILKYIKRVFSDIKSSDHVDNYVSNNRNMENGKFKKKFLSYIRQKLLQKDETKNPICTATPDFRSRILAITSTHSIKSGISLAVQIPEIYLHMYIERVFKDMTRSDNVEKCICNNINQTEEAFNDRLAAYMAQISKDEIENLLKEASADFVANIFVVSIENVTRRGSPIDKFHILIPNEYLKNYIAKVFADLISSDDIERYLQNNRNEPDNYFNEMLIAFMSEITEKEFCTLLRDQKFSSSSIKHLIVVDSRDSEQSPKSVLQHIQDKGILNCPECFVSDYIKRIMDYWKSGEVFDVFQNVNMKNQLFADLFINHLHQLDQPTQLQLAATIDNKTKSSTLVVSCHTETKSLQTGVCKTTWKNYPEIVSVLLNDCSTPIDVNKSIENGKTPLFMACAGGLEQIVTMLLGAKGIDVNKDSDEGETPLYAACAQGVGHIVALLLQNTSSKIDVNKCTKDGYSPLYEACCQRNFDIVLMLLKQKN